MYIPLSDTFVKQPKAREFWEFEKEEKKGTETTVFWDQLYRRSAAHNKQVTSPRSVSRYKQLLKRMALYLAD
jgi:hypothetical protein